MEKVYTVSQVNSYISSLFTHDKILNNISMKGEISNCKYHSSGHIYFTLKDSCGQISCIMFAGNAIKLRFRLEEGIGVIIQGNIRIYERDGKYQLYAETIKPDGIGALYEMFERMKKKLDSEGIFSKEHKKPIPFYSQRVGIVTASTGAAIQDIISISKRRNPFIQLILYPAQVQGNGAAESIIRGIKEISRIGADVIIIGRGGGSFEDLWAFNDEVLARTIYECKIPVISAVGHETDFTIADYAADLRAPTPSAAAELAVCEMGRIMSSLVDMHSDLIHGIQNLLIKERTFLEQYRLRLQLNSPVGKVEHKKKDLILANEQLQQLMKQRLSESRHRLSLMIERIKGASPVEKLQSGYSYLADQDGKNVSSVVDVKTGDIIMINVTDGKMEAEIKVIYPLK